MMTDPYQPSVSLIVPCYNEAEGIAHTLARLSAIAEECPGYRFEFLFVDDGSQDATESILAEKILEDARVSLVVLARNFGHQRAITAGLEYCSGDFIVILDADLQDPPELIPEILALLADDFDVVHTVRSDREVDPLFKQLSAWGFYAVMRRWVLPELPINAGDFKGFNRRVLKELLRYREHVRFLRGSLATIGFRQTELPFVRAKRHAGDSKYALRNMLRLARDAVVSNTALPMRVALYGGLLTLLLGLPVYTAAMVMLHTAAIADEPVAAVAGGLVIFFSALVLCFLGIAGEYLKVIVLEVKDRPLFIVRTLHNISPAEPVDEG